MAKEKVMCVVRRVWKASRNLACHRGLHGGGGLHDGDEGMRACHAHAGGNADLGTEAQCECYSGDNSKHFRGTKEGVCGEPEVGRPQLYSMMQWGERERESL